MAGAISSGRVASAKRASTERVAIERRTASISKGRFRLPGSDKKPTRRSFGDASSNNSRYFSARLAETLVSPVTMPPGRARLAANPATTMSPAAAWTTGVLGAALAAAIVADIGPATRVQMDHAVKRGEVIGLMGATGDAGGIPHVHFELSSVASGHPSWVAGVTFDPLPLIVGCFDPSNTYASDRLVLTYPIRCRN
jgi:hypothetical protein